ncbi:hypothetical protein GRI39_10645 [Altererythrobacter indicus]|uniref:ApeA N-terminal domain-containing protein n=1 Tax=Altericroceibacterium indicum TaxID=374177 RepID=A0A845AAG9_9SPHN|nr:hypothetical protein [Altericroceibacterium indicum]MXP26497.1 hypothetical protein [Altericroceibacterium indicum]
MAVKKVHLLLKTRVPEFMFNPGRKDGIVLPASKARSRITIKPVSPEKDEHGHHLGINARVARYFSATSEQFSYVQNFIHRRLKPYGESGLAFPLEHKDVTVVDGDGNIQKGMTFWYDWLPADIRQILEQQESEMWHELFRFLRLLRWHQNEPFPLPKQDDHSLYWRTASSGHYDLLPPRSSSFSGPTLGGIKWETDDQAEMRALWRSKTAEEPLAHELRSEAELIKVTSPRSALLMAASALEVGVKGHISRVAPVVEWLAFNVPSPPVHKVLRDYLPDIHASNARKLDWEKVKKLFNSCQIVGEDRNKLAHAGYTPDQEVIDRHLITVSDVLYVLDYLEGHDWVTEHVSDSTRNKLGWRSARNPRGFVLMKSGPSA